MEKALKKIVMKYLFLLFDLFISVLVLSSALLLKIIRRVGIWRLPLSKSIFNAVGIYPIRDHYYEPMFNPKYLRHPLSDIRNLPGIDWNVDTQLALLKQFHFNEEIMKIPKVFPGENGFYFDNPNFRPGDSDFLYNLIRLNQPKRIIEIGSGMSTMLAHLAIQNTKRVMPDYHCRHICIEPYEMPWLERVEGIEVVREIVEKQDKKLFLELDSGDILFIDSSHVIRPQGDVLTEYLEILPILRPGVYVHIHDIFSPRDYPKEWLIDEVKLWNEQYLLEAFLSCNGSFEIVGALNFLKHSYPEALSEKCPVFAEDITENEPGSFWIRSK